MPRLIEFNSRDEWLASRSQEPWPIGASDAAKIACGKLCEVWVEKKLGQRLDAKAMPFLELGHCLEPGILEAGRRILGWDLSAFRQTCTLAHTDHDWARCTPDAQRLNAEAKELSPVNAKNVSWQNPRFNDYRNGLIPDDHLFGAQWEMFVMGLDVAYVLALVGGSEVVPFRVERDDDIIRGMFAECAEFRERYLLGDEEPEPDASETTARAFAARVSYEEGAEILFEGKVAEAAIELTDLETEHKTRGERIDELKNVVRQAMATAKVGRAPNGVEWAWTEGKTRQLRRKGAKA